jgi:hypothetical protein
VPAGAPPASPAISSVIAATSRSPAMGAERTRAPSARTDRAHRRGVQRR